MEIFTNMFEADRWAAVPFHFWSVVMFVFGSMCGSFFNVCIYRMPLDLSVVSPPSHCPKCKYSIPFYLNIPLITWLWLRGKCANCREPISPRYFLVELLTGALFLGAWLMHGGQSAGLALAYCVFISGLLVATFIDFEHFIIPDEITFGGIGVGIVLSFFIPSLHQGTEPLVAVKQSVIGAAVGGGVVYAILRLGKLLFGRQKIDFETETEVVFLEDGLLIGEEKTPFEDLFYRDSDTIQLKARRLELPDRCFIDADVRLSMKKLVIGGEEFDPEPIKRMVAWTTQLVVPREAMGFGDVKFVAAIGAFTGWQGAMFSLFASSVIGAVAGVTMILVGRREWSAKVPYGPYIAAAAALWVYGAQKFVTRWMSGL